MYLYITASLTSYKWPCAHCNAGSNIYTIPTDHDYSLGYFVEFRFYNMRFNRGTFLNGELAPSSRPCLLFDVLVLSFFLSFFFFFFFFFTHANRITAHLFPCSNKRRKWFIHSNTRGSYSSLRCLLNCAPRNASRNASSTSP